MSLDTTINFEKIKKQHADVSLDILQRFGRDRNGRALVCDGKEGPLTRGATYLNPELFLRAAELFAAHPKLTPNQQADLTPQALGTYIHPVAVAMFEDVWAGAQEELGNNRGPHISKIYEDPNESAQQGAWCGMQGRHAIRKVYPLALPQPKKSWLAKGLARQLERVEPMAAVRSGDQITYNRKVDGSFNNDFGHATTCAARVGDEVWTFEGNVDLKPGVDGVAARCYLFSKKLVNASGGTVWRISRWPERTLRV